MQQTPQKIAFVDLRRQYAAIGAEIEAEALAVLRSCSFIAGARVARFEQDFAKAHDAAYCVALNSGTAALHLALWGLGIGPGDEVIVPVNTYIATAEGVSLQHAKPVFVDHDEYYNMDVKALERAVTPRTRAVIPVHLYGQPARMDEIRAFCAERRLHLVEDCAQAHLATLNGRPVGALGAVGCFSFYPGKNLGACGEGGAVTTNDKALYERMLKLRQHGVSTDKYHHWLAGHNYRMEELQGACLNVKLKHLADWTEKRRANARLYREKLAGVRQVVCPTEMPGAKPVYHLFVIQAENRDKLMAFLGEKGVATGLHYPTPLHLQPAYADLGYKPGAFPVAEAACKRIVSLPMFAELTADEVAYTCDGIREFYKA